MSDSGEGEPPHDEYHCPDGKSPSVGEWTGNDGSPSDADVAKPAPTRKRNLYVTVACASCKKAHVACDESRPCKRCVRLKKGHTCEDAAQRKRGWPKGRLRGAGFDDEDEQQQEQDDQDDKPRRSSRSAVSSPSSRFSSTVWSLSPAPKTGRRKASPEESVPSPGDQRHIEWITLGDGSIVHFDDPRAKLGYDHEQVLGKSIFALVGHEDVSVLQGIFAVARQVHDTDVAMRVRFTGADGRTVFTQGRVRASTDGLVYGKCSQFEPQQLGNLNGIDASHAVAFTAECAVSPLGDHVVCSNATPEVESILGYPISLVLGDALLACIHPDDVHLFELAKTNLLAASWYHDRIRMRLKHALGHYVQVDCHLRLVLNATSFVPSAIMLTIRSSGNHSGNGSSNGHATTTVTAASPPSDAPKSLFDLFSSEPLYEGLPLSNYHSWIGLPSFR